jgi:hypothetical protein
VVQRRPSDAVNTARYNLDTELLGDSECQTNPCVNEVESLQEYSEMKEACKEADGSFHVFSVALACPHITLQFNDYPDCFVSQTQNPECTRDYLEAYMDFLWDQDNGNCTTTSSETEVIDFSGASDVPTPPPAFPTDPPAFPTDSPAAPTDSPIQPIREKPEDADECSLLSEDGVFDAVSNLYDELATFIDDCLSSPCIINLDSTQAYSALKDVCQEAQGGFHTYTYDISCDRGYNFELDNFPVCGVSETTNPNCNSDLFGDILEFELDVENCTETATHTETIDFDEPDATVAPTAVPVATPRTAAPQPPPLTPSPRTTGIVSSSSDLSAMAPKNSRSIGLALIFSWACAHGNFM